MIISVSWLKQFTQIDASIDELTEAIGARLVEIESVEALGGKYKDVIIARIVESAPVPDSDHLNLTKIDDGSVVPQVERDENGHVQVVCGAPNVRVGMLVAWLPPGSTVPDTYGTAEPFVLDARTLRGYVSNGMLASARELDLFDDHEGIVEVDKEVAPGTPFVSAYALDDYLLDIENKSLTHRPDTFGVVGFAREVAAIAGKGFNAPEWLENLSPPYGDLTDSVPLSVTIDNAELSSRYQAVTVGILNPHARPPLEMQTYLSRSGVRPINLIVDITNYLMLLTGQPLHAFDYDKVVALTGSPHVHVREGYIDETLALLDGRTITLTPDDIVIAAGDIPIALGGAMGGADTEIDASTTRIIIESASFNLYNLRRTQMRHGIFSEAITRFTKGQPAALTAPVLAQAVALLMQYADARRISDVADDYPIKARQPTLTVPITQVNGVLGTRFSVDDAVETLTNVQFDITAHGETFSATAPYWRTDIHINEDVIEEIGRINGFDSIEPTLPRRDFTAVCEDAVQTLRQRMRMSLTSAGSNEILTYSFVNGELLKRAGQSSDDAYALSNALSPDLQYYRLSLTPSILDKVSMNLRQKFDEFALFEFGKTHIKGAMDSRENDVPAEQQRVAFVYAATSKRTAGRGDAYYTARHYVAHLLRSLHIEAVSFVPLVEQAHSDGAIAPFEPQRSAEIYAGGMYLGVIGEYKRSVQHAFKLPEFSAGFELLLEPLQSLAREIGKYNPLSRFPSTESDVTFALPGGLAFGTLDDALRKAANSELLTISYDPRDSYVPDHGDTIHYTIRFTIGSSQRTLTRDDVNGVIERIGSSVSESVPGLRII